MEQRRATRQTLIRACALILLGAGAIDAQAQTGVETGRPASGKVESRRQDDSHRQDVERKKDDFDARIPFDTPHRLAALPSSGDYRIDALLSGYTLSTTTVTYSFYNNAVFGGAYYGSETVTEVSEGVKTNVRAIMAFYGAIMNVSFVEVAETSGSIGYIRFMRSNGPSYAYAYYPSSSAMFSLSGDVHLNPSYDRLGDTNGFQHPAGEHGYTSLIHEVGHALGLKHPHDGSPNLPSSEDNHSHTVMSYGFPGESPGTPMGYDVLALHYMYGARPLRTGNDVYTFTRTAIDQFATGGQTFLNPSYTTKQIIWDSGGYNVIDLSGIAASSSGYRLDLRPLGWLSTNSYYQSTYLNAGVVIGPGVSVRQVINSVGNDTIYANAQPNVFSGYAANRATGADVLYDADGTDTIDLSGYAAGQVLETATGNDLVLGFGANGSLTVKNYYAAATRPSIVYDAVVPQASIGDVTVSEGNSGTSAVFTVTLSVPAASAQSIAYTTVDGTAQGGSDFVAASGTVTFAAGEMQKTIVVSIVSDTTVEADEVFSVVISAPGGGVDIVDGQADGTIVNDDLPPNQLPVAQASATPVSGYSPLTVAFTGSSSYDTDGSIASYSWTFGDGASSSAANPSHTYTTVGTFVATLTVVDNRGGASSTSKTITVQADPNAVAYVGDIAMQKVASSGGSYAQATVLIRRPNGTPVAGATVTGAWSGLVTGLASAVTDANGRIVLKSKKVAKKTGNITFRVTNVTASGLTYDASRNVETTDSISLP
jgi:PKD repeat protein